MASTMVHVRIDETVKEQASSALKAMGISISDAVRIMLIRVATERALPFDLRVPNQTSVRAMRSAEKGRGRRFRSAKKLFDDLGI